MRQHGQRTAWRAAHHTFHHNAPRLCISSLLGYVQVLLQQTQQRQQELPATQVPSNRTSSCTLPGSRSSIMSPACSSSS